MPSLSQCLKKMKVPQEERNLIEGYASAYRKEGFKAGEANKRAVQDMIKDLDDEYASIVKQVERGMA